jgi:hypothetical protein
LNRVSAESVRRHADQSLQQQRLRQEHPVPGSAIALGWKNGAVRFEVTPGTKCKGLNLPDSWGEDQQTGITVALLWAWPLPVTSRYERASMIVTSNKPFSAWGEIFGDDMAATAMIDRLIHHAEILSLKGDSYRLPGKDLDARPSRRTG